MAEKKHSVLIVEDDPQMANMLTIYLQNDGFHVTVAQNGQEALDIFHNYHPDIIVSDIMMPNMDGFAFRHHLLQDSELRLIPFIFLSAKGKVEEKVDGLKMSVDDYITKPFALPELVARIESILERHQRFSDLIKYDSLTKLYNRRTLGSMLRTELNRAKRYNLKLSVFLLDVDYFKTCNDTFGHAFGDYVLIMVAEKLLTQFRDVDFAGRLGGDEFVVIMPETDKESCFLVAERLRNSLAGLKLNEKDFQISISGGIACAPEDGLQLEALLEKADNALYEAKRRGRNQIVGYMQTYSNLNEQPTLQED